MGVIENYKASPGWISCNRTTYDPWAWRSLCYSFIIHADSCIFVFYIGISEDTEPLLLGLFNLLLHLGRLHWLVFHSSLLGLGILLTLAKYNSHRVLGLDSVHLHEKSALGYIVEMVGSVVPGFLGLVLLVQDNNVLPGDEEVERVRPEV